MSGSSMVPTLGDGEMILINPYTRSYAIGMVVLCMHPVERLEDGTPYFMVKRISDIQSGGVFVLGDNPPASTDSRHFGWLSNNLIVGEVVSFFVPRKQG